jgi:hypothetical protein
VPALRSAADCRAKKRGPLQAVPVPCPFLSGKYVADLLPRVVEFSVVILTERREKLLEFVTMLARKRQHCHKVVP